MPNLTNRLFFGIGIGVAVTLVALHLWGAHLDRTVSARAQVQLLRPLAPRPPLEALKSSQALPRAWFPQPASGARNAWRIRGLDGHAATLGDFEGKVAFLSFWLTTCAPCIAEMPALERLRESLRGEPIEFLAVTPEAEEQVRGFLAKVPLKLPVYLSEGPLPEELPLLGYPTTFIIDPNGVAVFRHIGPANWDDDAARSFIRRLASN